MAQGHDQWPEVAHTTGYTGDPLCIS
jgi:hypothetical protein